MRKIIPLFIYLISFIEIRKFKPSYKRPANLNTVVCRLTIGPHGEILERKYVSGSISHLPEMAKIIDQLHLFPINKEPFTITLVKEFEP